MLTYRSQVCKCTNKLSTRALWECIVFLRIFFQFFSPLILHNSAPKCILEHYFSKFLERIPPRPPSMGNVLLVYSYSLLHAQRFICSQILNPRSKICSHLKMLRSIPAWALKSLPSSRIPLVSAKPGCTVMVVSYRLRHVRKLSVTCGHWVDLICFATLPLSSVGWYWFSFNTRKVTITKMFFCLKMSHSVLVSLKGFKWSMKKKIQYKCFWWFVNVCMKCIVYSIIVWNWKWDYNYVQQDFNSNLPNLFIFIYSTLYYILKNWRKVLFLFVFRISFSFDIDFYLQP